MNSKIKRKVLGEGTTLVVYEPGNCTSYKVLFQTLSGEFADMLGAGDEPCTVVSVLNHDARPFLVPSYAWGANPGYFEERTGLGQGDAKPLCELIEFFLFNKEEKNDPPKEDYQAEEGFGPKCSQLHDGSPQD